MALDRDTVVDAALRLLNETGLEGLSLRRLATDLHVQAPALYWHFKSKQELLDEMATAILRRAIGTMESTAGGESWSEWLRGYGEGLRRMLLAYRDGARVFSGTYLTDPAMYAMMERALARLVDAGFTPSRAARGLGTVYSFTIGFVIEEQAVYPRPGERSPQYDPQKRAGRIDAGKYPLAHAVGEDVVADFDERFAFGLGVIIVGLESLLEQGSRKGTGRSGKRG